MTAIRRTHSGWIVTSNGTDHEARSIVNAAGAWVDEIARMAGIKPLGFTPCAALWPVARPWRP